MIRLEGTCRLFPLPGVVLFPHGVLRLHVFEPRYRQLTAHALASDRLITIVQVRLDASWPLEGEPPLEQVGCVGRIVAHDRLADGRYNLLLLGVGRVRLRDETDRGTLYRQADATALEDVRDRPGLEGERRRLAELVRRVAGGEDPELRRLIGSGGDIGALIDAMAHALPLDPRVKQELLDETRVGRRLDRLRQELRAASDERPEPPEPEGRPPSRGFSAN